MNSTPRFSLFSCLIFVCHLVISQNEEIPDSLCLKLPCIECYLPSEVFQPRNNEVCCEPLDDPIVNGRLDARKRNYHFFQSLTDMQPPSTLAGGGITSYTFNTLGYDKKNFILDADVKLPIPIGGKRFGLNTIQVIPRFMVRIFADDPKVPFGPMGDISLPVRTPSTIPGLAYYFSFKNWWSPEKQWNKKLSKFNRSLPKDERDTNIGDNKYFGIYGFHHSDGQDGNEIYPNDSINQYNGNFGEQWVFEFIYGQQRNFVPRGDDYGSLDSLNSKRKKRIIENHGKGREVFIKETMGYRLNWRLSLEWHPYALTNFVFRDLSLLGPYPKRSRIYGRTYLNGRVSWHFLPTLIEYISNGEQWCAVNPGSEFERWRLMANFSYILDSDYYRGPNMNELVKVKPFGLNRRLNFTVDVYHIFKRSRHVAAFAEASYLGSDPYNIYFNDSLWQFKFGLAFGFFSQSVQNDKTR